MNKIAYDEHGNIFPYKVIKLTLDECVEHFIEDFDNEPIRSHNWNNLLKYRTDFFNILKYDVTQWIDGSYTTSKQKPNDIDVVTFIDYLDFDITRITKFDMNLSRGYPKFKYNIDGYVVVLFPQGHPHHRITIDRLNYWKKWFGHDRDKNPKAIIEIK